MTIKIYQINTERDTEKMIFKSLKRLEKLGAAPDPALYDLVFDGEVPEEDLEDVYAHFNRIDTGVPRRLSVSDVVEVVSAKKYGAGCFYCDSYGWDLLPEFDTAKTRRGK